MTCISAIMIVMLSSLWHSCYYSKSNCSFLWFCPSPFSSPLFLSSVVNASIRSCRASTRCFWIEGWVGCRQDSSKNWETMVWFSEVLARAYLFLLMERVLSPLYWLPQTPALPTRGWGAEATDSASSSTIGESPVGLSSGLLDLDDDWA